MKTDLESVKEAFGEEGNFIKLYEIVDKTNELRFIEVSDRVTLNISKILQQKVCVKVHFSKPIYRSFGGNIVTDEKLVWLTVPVRSENDNS